MRIYFSGIGGVGIGPLAQIALDAGYEVLGSDIKESELTKALTDRGARVFIGQNGTEIATAHEDKPIDWFVYTAALTSDHPELRFTHDHNIKSTKRDELLAEIIKQKDLKLIAVSGTHGKTTTTGMLIWVMKELGIPTSYSVGSSLTFGPSGTYIRDSEYFVYECDEFDRNMLHFYPHLTLITSLDHDHFDTYPTIDSYRESFVDFIQQSDYNLLWEKDLHYLKTDIKGNLEAYDDFMDLDHIKLLGDHNRHNAFLVEQATRRLLPDTDPKQLTRILNEFPGTVRRFEKLADNLYSDYGHHPVEIAATLQLAHELNDQVCLVYQPHQNVRQHEVKDEYPESLNLAYTVYWLPTYLSREHPDQEVLSPEQLTSSIKGNKVILSELDDQLWKNIEAERTAGRLVLVMGAGSIDSWVRQQLAGTT